jgi:hypothetical protein
MTAQELELLRVRMKVVAQEAILEWLVTQLRLTHTVAAPEIRSRLLTGVKETLQKARLEYSDIAFPEMSPAQSDLQAAEFQEAFDSVAGKIEASLGLS